MHGKLESYKITLLLKPPRHIQQQHLVPSLSVYHPIKLLFFQFGIREKIDVINNCRNKKISTFEKIL